VVKIKLRLMGEKALDYLGAKRDCGYAEEYV
jgi:GDP-D-mannose dehydratase